MGHPQLDPGAPKDSREKIKIVWETDVRLRNNSPVFDAPSRLDLAGPVPARVAGRRHDHHLLKVGDLWK